VLKALKEEAAAAAAKKEKKKKEKAAAAAKKEKKKKEKAAAAAKKKPGTGTWTTQEDQLLLSAVSAAGPEGIKSISWVAIAQSVPGRSGSRVRERWYDRLDPQLNKGPWTPDEVAELVKLQAQFGNKWAKIAEKMPGRSPGGVITRWRSMQSRKRKAKSMVSSGNEGKDKSNKRRDI
jgi:hypothetical protein